MKKILILSANPINTNPLRLSEEIRDIKNSLRSSQKRDEFDIIPEEAVRLNELQISLVKNKPNILHFAGHGGGEDGLAFMDENGEAILIKPDSLKRFFEALQHIFKIDCVVLNACYSEVQAEAISPYVDYVIGMNQEIGDTAARKFAMGFYDTLFAGESIENAFNMGCSAIDMAGIDEYLTPMLKKKTNLTPNHVTDNVIESVGGQVALNSPFYIERPNIESYCYNTILKAGALIRIKAPQKMGKTSLISRILAEGQKQNYQTVFINLWSRELFKNLDSFFKSFCAYVSLELGIEDKIDTYWNSDRYTSQTNCTNYFQSYLLKELKNPVILGLDEVDRIFQYTEIADEFFTMLRSWYEKAKNDKTWEKLRLVISHSQEVYITDVNKSPFNVGLSIELSKFNLTQVKDLIQRHGLQWSDTEINQLMEMVNGHPYLVRLALYYCATNQLTLNEFLKIAPTEEGLYKAHLHRHLLILEENKDLKSAMLKLVNSDEPITLDPTCTFKLKSMGLAESKGNKVILLCNLYRLYFGDRLKN